MCGAATCHLGHIMTNCRHFEERLNRDDMAKLEGPNRDVMATLERPNRDDMATLEGPNRDDMATLEGPNRDDMATLEGPNRDDIGGTRVAECRCTHDMMMTGGIISDHVSKISNRYLETYNTKAMTCRVSAHACVCR